MHRPAYFLQGYARLSSFPRSLRIILERACVCVCESSIVEGTEQILLVLFCPIETVYALFFFLVSIPNNLFALLMNILTIFYPHKRLTAKIPNAPNFTSKSLFLHVNVL